MDVFGGGKYEKYFKYIVTYNLSSFYCDRNGDYSMAASIQNLAFVVMTLLIIGIFGIIRFIAHKTAMR